LPYTEYTEILEICSILLRPESDTTTLAHALVLAGCLIQAHGAEFFHLVPLAAEVLTAKQRGEVLLGAVYVFASAFFADGARAAGEIPLEVMELIVAGVIAGECVAYRERKLEVIVLCWFAKMGNVRALQAAVAILPMLAEVKGIDEGLESVEERERVHRGERLMSLTPLVQMPIDALDEMALFEETATEAGIIGQLSEEVRALLSGSV
jgi:hypothetical protein